MQHTHFFKWNIPADNQYSGSTDKYINIIATWQSDQFYLDGRPMVFIDVVNATIYDCISVLNWAAAVSDIKKIAEQLFADMAKAERIAKARETLIAEGESNIPTLDRYEIDKKHAAWADVAIQGEENPILSRLSNAKTINIKVDETLLARTTY